MYDLHRELGRLEQELAARADEATLRRYADVQERFGARRLGFRAPAGRRRAHLGIAHLEDRIPWRDLSGGEQARVLLAGVLLRGRPCCCSTSPPTTSTCTGCEWLEEYLGSFRGAVLVVSHDRRFLDHTVRRTFELDGVHDELQVYEGGYTAYRAERQRRFERLLQEHREQERRRRELEAAIRRLSARAQTLEDRFKGGGGMDYARSLAKKIARQAKTRRRRLERSDADRVLDRRPRAGAQLHPVARRRVRGRPASGRRALRAGRAGRPHGAAAAPTCSCTAATGWRSSARTAVARRRSCGWCRASWRPTAGRAAVSAAAGSLPQDHSALPLDRSALEYYRSRVVGHEDEARALLGYFLFEQEQLTRPMATLSPGERSRLLIAVLVSAGAELLLLDEPTNHLDFDSLDVVEEALRQFRGTIVAVTHDRAFIDNIGCTRVVEVHAGRTAELTR